MTVVGLALAAMLPVVRSAPGLSKTPTRGLGPASPVFATVDAPATDSGPASPSPDPSGRPEEGRADPGSTAEGSASTEWVAIRPSRGREADRSRATSEAARSGGPAARRVRHPILVDASPGPGLPVRLRRLLS